MKLKLLSLVFLLLLLYSSTPIVVNAQGEHTLEWGVDVGEEFTYVMQRAYFADPSYVNVIAADFPFVPLMTVGEKVTLRVISLPVIPTLINESSQMVNSTCEMEREGDSVPFYEEIRDFVVPIGDWEFLTEITNITGLEGITLIDTDEEWGTIGAGNIQAQDGSIISISLEIRYEKENGTLNYLRYRFSTLGTDLIDIIIVNWHVGMPTIAAVGLQPPVILIISIGAVVCFIVSILVYQGYRGKKSIAQKLGE